MNRQSWTAQEDQAIIKLVVEHGIDDWTKIATKLKENYSIMKRTGKQCRERWHNHLNPHVNKKPWDSDQEIQLFELHKLYGNKWKDVSKHFFGRTDNDIKNHFYSTLRRSLRRLNKILGQKNSTSQMREIKPSVLSTIMNFIYEKEQALPNDFVSSLKDLPLLIFQFANFKPIKDNINFHKLHNVRDRIASIFSLISRFNEEYETEKGLRNAIKMQRKNSQVSNQSKQNIKIQSPFEISNHVNGVKIQQCESFNMMNEKTAVQFNQCKLFDFEEYGEIIKEEEENEGKNYHRKQFYNENGNIDSISENGQNNAFHNHGMSFEEEQLAMRFDDPEEPSRMSMEEPLIDLVIVGRHWVPQAWDSLHEQNQVVDEIFAMDYDE